MLVEVLTHVEPQQEPQVAKKLVEMDTTSAMKMIKLTEKILTVFLIINNKSCKKL